MAPEQFNDTASVDVRTDIYAFGIVMYEMLAGRRPFRGYSAARLRHAHLHAKPSPPGGLLPRRWRRFSEAIDAVVLRCLEKDPALRYPTAAALRKDVQILLRQVDPTWKP
jgi:serine/threonine-protein kinase